MLELLFLLLPVAAGYGWVMGRNSARQAQRKQSKLLSRHYYKGLNFLLSDQPDKAVDTLIKMMDINSDTAETHIAMGNFFRHRGELDRAIRVHQNLVDQEQLSTSLKETALKELGRDYLLAGFLEQAESVASKLLSSDKYYLDAQKQLFTIYQSTKEWEQAIALAERVTDRSAGGEELSKRVGHFYCEHASVLWRKQALEEAERYLHKAVMADDGAVRPWLLMAKMAIEQHQFKTAMEYLEQIPARDVRWLSEAIPLMRECYDSEPDVRDAFIHVLDSYHEHCATAYLAKVRVMAEGGDVDGAAEFLLRELRQHPTMKGFHSLLNLLAHKSEGQAEVIQTLELLQELVAEQLQQRPLYRCTSCGFSGRQVYWLCPSCKQWGTIKPIKGLDGE